MRGRAAAVLALLGCAILLLATTQPWYLTVTEVAPGAPRTRGTVIGSEVVPWVAAAAGVSALAVLLDLSRWGWAWLVALPAGLAALGGTVWAACGAGRPVGATVVAATPTGWLWVAAVAALLAVGGIVLLGPPRRRRPDGARGRGRGKDGTSPDLNPHGWEAARRRQGEDWRDLSEGRDPTDT